MVIPTCRLFRISTVFYSLQGDWEGDGERPPSTSNDLSSPHPQDPNSQRKTTETDNFGDWESTNSLLTS